MRRLFLYLTDPLGLGALCYQKAEEARVVAVRAAKEQAAALSKVAK
jgi:hypothetical protein